jgi:RNA-binding proteins (RRM domain)
MNIYISNLSFGTQGDSLQDLFEEYGEVSSAKIITDRETGRSRGFGFVEMPSDEDGQNAIDKLNNVEFEGKVISVNVARPRENRNEGGYNNNRGGGYNRGGGNGYNSRRY